jgi:L-amino acid N-acyltransferase YncA
VEVSVYVHPQAHRCGVGRALYAALFDLLRRQGYVNAYAGITLPNPASMGLHESLGFVNVGVFRRIGFKLDRWHDVAWLHFRLAEDPRPLRDPLPVVKLWREPGVTAMLEACAQSAELD